MHVLALSTKSNAIPVAMSTTSTQTLFFKYIPYPKEPELLRELAYRRAQAESIQDDPGHLPERKRSS